MAPPASWFDSSRFFSAWAQQPWAGTVPPLALAAEAELDSTNQALWNWLVRDPVQPPAVAIARQQRAGRGQWGRPWQSLPGGLYLSLALPAGGRLGPLLTLAIAHRLAQVLRQRGIPVQLKWPNDLILQGRKLGGLLCEARSRGETVQVIAGLGLNWANPVPDQGISLQTWQQASGVTALPDLETLAAIASYALWTGSAQAQADPAWLEDYWQLVAHPQGPVQVQGQPGLALGLTPTGALRVRLQSSGRELACQPGQVQIDYRDLAGSA